MGGHDLHRIYAAYKAAIDCKGKPTVILARSIKGYGLGPTFAGRNATHGKKKADNSALHFMRDKIGLDLSDEELEKLPISFLKIDRMKLHIYVNVVSR